MDTPSDDTVYGTIYLTLCKYDHSRFEVINPKGLNEQGYKERLCIPLEGKAVRKYLLKNGTPEIIREIQNYKGKKGILAFEWRVPREKLQLATSGLTGSDIVDIILEHDSKDDTDYTPDRPETPTTEVELEGQEDPSSSDLPI